MPRESTTRTLVELAELDWEFAELSKPLAEGRKSPPRIEKLTWHPARVPGCFLLDLMEAGLLGDPFCAQGEDASRVLEGKDWIYRAAFDGDPPLTALTNGNGQLTLVFDGLDTFASVWLNGRLLGETDNMFIPWEFDVSRVVRKGSNELLVGFSSVVRRGRDLEKKHGVLGSGFCTERVYVRKAQCQFGWDWGPRIVSAGIWRPGRVSFVPSPHIEDFCVRTLRLNGNAADVEISGTLSCPLRGGAVRFEILDGHDLLTDKIVAPSGRSFKMQWRIRPVEAWWPWALGVPKLYRVRATLLGGGEPLHAVEKAVGFRTICLDQKKDRYGESFCFKVNGKSFFARGANWIPPDVFPVRVSRGDYDHLLSRAVMANMDMLRIWGGGFYESEDFYQACDRLGLLVWQDFMFACAEYPETPAFRSQIRREAESVIGRLRHHPCVALWCGNNENEWGHLEGWFSPREKLPGRSVYEKILPDVCRRLDPSRPCWQSSPFGDPDDPNGEKEGDRHNWYVWSQWQPYENYRNDQGRFLSEFGFQSLASPDLWKSLSSGAPHSALAPQLAAHQKQPDGDGRLWRYLVEYLRLPRDFEDYCFLTQLNQAEAMRIGIEHWRRRWPQTAGALLWQLDDCWPAISWS
ncbi:MAG: sugar-binding domain-containing protein, partial [bacterium]